MRHPQYMDHMDNAESLHVQRALNQIETEVYNTEFPPLEGMKYVPVDDSYDEGALSTSYRQYTRTGIATMVTGRGKDLPTIGLFVKEYTHKFYDIGACYRYSLRDLMAAQFANRNGFGSINLETEKAVATREAIERGLDAVTGIGSTTSSTIPGLDVGVGPDVGLLGLLNQPNASTYTPASAAGGGGQTWAVKTPDEIIADMHGICRAQIAATYKRFPPNRLLIPIDQMEIIRSVRMGDGSDESILSLFQKQRPGVVVDSWQYCEGAGSGGTDRMVAFIGDKRYVKLALSLRFKQLPAEFRNREFKTDCLARTAGVFSPYPISITYADGI
jgi:hypothetical protein